MCSQSTCNLWKLCINYYKLIKCCNKSFNSSLLSLSHYEDFCHWMKQCCLVSIFLNMIFCFVNSAILWRILENSTHHFIVTACIFGKTLTIRYAEVAVDLWANCLFISGFHWVGHKFGRKREYYPCNNDNS